ncbi:MAG TPA: hypothetical protein PK328_14115, partial [Chitinophagaceae bacterium]|nr:hypothetical protein [Chitinophagaceae bacterium]
HAYKGRQHNFKKKLQSVAFFKKIPIFVSGCLILMDHSSPKIACCYMKNWKSNTAFHRSCPKDKCSRITAGTIILHSDSSIQQVTYLSLPKTDI